MAELSPDLEARLLDDGIEPIAGIDEVGRGPLAGPVVAAAVIWDYRFNSDSINDSKKITTRRRENIYHYIISKCRAVGIGWVSPSEIDRMNILQASLMAMNRASLQLELKPRILLIDGKYEIPFSNHRQIAIIGGDSKVLAISAASIIAKVTRDNLMVQMDKFYPGYGFAKNMGYPTKKHFEAIEKLGPCPIHRRSFKPFNGKT